MDVTRIGVGGLKGQQAAGLKKRGQLPVSLSEGVGGKRALFCCTICKAHCQILDYEKKEATVQGAGIQISLD